MNTRSTLLGLIIGVSLLIASGATASENETSIGSNYTLQPMDLVTVSVFGEPELEKLQRIDGTGKIRIGLVGTLPVAGLTLEEAEELIERTFTQMRYLREPQVSVEVKEYAPHYVSVLGQVNKPGRIQLEDESRAIRLVDAISAAGGFTGIAKSDAVRVTRKQADGTEETFTVDVNSLINGRVGDVPALQLELRPGDVVNIPERLF